VSSIDIPLDSGDFCCMRRPVVDAIVNLPERNRFLRGLRAWVGYRQVGVDYERSARYAGEPKYTLRKLLGLAYDGYFSFTSMPTRLMQLAGFTLSALAILVAALYCGWYFIDPTRFPRGFATLVISIWFLAGVQLFSLGVLGEYIWRISDETRRRPVALVREIVRTADWLGDVPLVPHTGVQQADCAQAASPSAQTGGKYLGSVPQAGVQNGHDHSDGRVVPR
jgi:dolichol-phosphate mannosyltransferase